MGMFPAASAQEVVMIQQKSNRNKPRQPHSFAYYQPCQHKEASILCHLKPWGCWGAPASLLEVWRRWEGTVGEAQEGLQAPLFPSNFCGFPAKPAHAQAPTYRGV